MDSTIKIEIEKLYTYSIDFCVLGKKGRYSSDFFVWNDSEGNLNIELINCEVELNPAETQYLIDHILEYGNHNTWSVDLLMARAEEVYEFNK